MFKEASKYRAIVHKHQRENPLTFDEVVAAGMLSFQMYFSQREIPMETN
jgi:hypothetical protein